jgi:glutathionylspermidine synthase
VRREHSEPRPGWQQIIESQGMGFHRTSHPAHVARPYWDESVHYTFTMDEVLRVEEAVEELQGMCLEAADWVVKKGRYDLLGLPEHLAPGIEASWKRRDPHVYGRFDLRYDGVNPPKMLEYNADTPTCLVESSIIQWYWKEDLFPADDQWNSLHERLVDRWKEIPIRPGPVHFAWTEEDDSGEEYMTAAYMQETAEQAGRLCIGITMQDIGWDGHDFRDNDLNEIKTLWKLYPWEWIVTEEFGAYRDETDWVEPMWKMLLSNKGLLAVLWELFPNHPNLLRAYVGTPGNMKSHIKKPLLGREGESMEIVAPGFQQATEGTYGVEGFVYQEFLPLPEFEGQHPVIGAWMVGDESAGIGIRETPGLITDTTSSFIPHRILLS